MRNLDDRAGRWHRLYSVAWVLAALWALLIGAAVVLTLSSPYGRLEPFAYLIIAMSWGALPALVTARWVLTGAWRLGPRW